MVVGILVAAETAPPSMFIRTTSHSPKIHPQNIHGKYRESSQISSVTLNSVYGPELRCEALRLDMLHRKSQTHCKCPIHATSTQSAFRKSQWSYHRSRIGIEFIPQLQPHELFSLASSSFCFDGGEISL